LIGFQKETWLNCSLLYPNEPPGSLGGFLLPLLHHSCTATVVIAVQAVRVAHRSRAAFGVANPTLFLPAVTVAPVMAEGGPLSTDCDVGRLRKTDTLARRAGSWLDDSRMAGRSQKLHGSKTAYRGG
jgi:hypothetical protein